MISFDDFITTWTGKGIDFDHVFGDQCVDLYHQYCQDVFGIYTPPVPVAKDLWTTYPTQSFDRIANTPSGVPSKGDVMIYGPYGTIYGQAGHVDVFIAGDVTYYTAFSQNFPTGSLCHVQKHDYRGVIGWLHFKGQNPLAAFTTRQLLQEVLTRV